ncbi:hypothetical protein AVDCRST_MAG81-2685 [uncultured Synechococcales cyanobacterium]|uniref:Uncharacterized protein n=1 Tax=uncultured Synechococcales cyanobacterium TaxID=1936017 RepID=A0A6J4VKH7_9CYAN|nr:hypothetical protein AVDCRST_MAG81-2685 [uncultured Synechococcales cyanobacterium]
MIKSQTATRQGLSSILLRADDRTRTDDIQLGKLTVSIDLQSFQPSLKNFTPNLPQFRINS